MDESLRRGVSLSAIATSGDSRDAHTTSWVSLTSHHIGPTSTAVEVWNKRSSGDRNKEGKQTKWPPRDIVPRSITPPTTPAAPTVQPACCNETWSRTRFRQKVENARIVRSTIIHKTYGQKQKQIQTGVNGVEFVRSSRRPRCLFTSFCSFFSLLLYSSFSPFISNILEQACSPRAHPSRDPSRTHSGSAHTRHTSVSIISKR